MKMFVLGFITAFAFVLVSVAVSGTFLNKKSDEQEGKS